MSKKIYKLAGIAAIILAAIFIPQLFLISAITIFKLSGPIIVIEKLMNVIILLLSILVLRGYYTLAKNEEALRTIVLIAIVLQTLFIIATPFENLQNSAGSIYILIIGGILDLLMGIFLVRIRPVIANMSKAIGVLYIIMGACEISVLLSFIAIIVQIAVPICEAVMFLRLAKEKKVR